MRSTDRSSSSPPAARPLRGRSCAALAVLALALIAITGCSPERKAVIPRAAFTERTDFRVAVEGRDSTIARVTWPDFVGARTPAALDSLRAMVQALLLAPAGSSREPAATTAVLLDGFIEEWSETRRATGSRSWWRFDRRVEVLAETLGVVSLAVTEFAFTGGAHPNTSVKLVNVDADHGTTLRFADLFDEALRDSLSAALEPAFRELRGVPRDSTLRSAGFSFVDDRFHVNDNVAITLDGVRWHFDAYEIGPYALGATDLVVPFEAVRPFARRDGPLDPKRR